MVSKNSLWLLLALLTGCASTFNQPHQFVTVSTFGSEDYSADCTLSNEEGTWKGRASTQIKVHRDGNPMQVECKNGDMTGFTVVHPDFDAEYVILDLLFDLCIISCPIDAYTNSFYDYPAMIQVPMKRNYASE